MNTLRSFPNTVRQAFFSVGLSLQLSRRSNPARRDASPYLDPGGDSSRRWRRVGLPLALVAIFPVAGVADPGPGSPTPATAKPSAAATDRDRELKAASQDAAIVKHGREVFAALCHACHGGEGASGDAVSNLFDAKWHHGGTPAEIERTILTGVLDQGMPGWGEVLPAEDTTALTAYLLSVQK
jgi:mono/diheme cytochrome c family protein